MTTVRDFGEGASINGTLKLRPTPLRALAARVRRWELWSLRPAAALFVLAVDGLYICAVVVGALTTHFRAGDLATFGALVGCGIVSIEGSLRLVWRRPPSDGGANNLLAVWTVPVALLLPPVYGALAIAPLVLLCHVRLYRGSPMKMAFNAASGGLAAYVASTVHVTMMPGFTDWGAADLVGSGAAIAATIVCLAVRSTVNMGLVAQVVALVRPGGFGAVVLNTELWSTIAAESCIGALVAVACAASPLALLFCIVPALVLQRTLLLAELRHAARTDAKTGLANSSYWREVAERELARARGGSDNLAVLLVDVDHFKLINDRFGHLTGDEVLRTVANGLTHGLRPHDLVGRFGGEEFVVLLVGSDIEQGQNAAERIREHVAALDIDVLHRQEPVRVTISIGVAAFRESGHSVHELLDAADGALYAAKHAGRNCVRLAEGAWQQVLDITEHEPHVIDLRSHPARVE